MEAVAVALIASVIGPSVLHLLNQRSLKARIGTQNGSGNLYQVTERIEAKVDELGRRVTGVEGRTAAVETRLGNCEAELGDIREAVNR